MENAAQNTQQQQQIEAMKDLIESCPVKAIGSAVGGYGLGFAFGLFLSSSDWNQTDEFLKLSTRKQIQLTIKDMGQKSHAGAKHWSKLGATFGESIANLAFSECVLESYRGKHDIWNSISAGCVSGAAISAKNGPQAMAFGCAGFAAFSAAIDLVLKHYDFD